jgi:hypothetical protein
MLRSGICFLRCTGQNRRLGQERLEDCLSNIVILSGVGTSRSEIPAESKDPYPREQPGVPLIAPFAMSRFGTSQHSCESAAQRFWESTFVKLGARPRRSPSQAHPIAQPCPSTPAGTVIAALANDLFQPGGQQRADRGAFFGGQNARLAEKRGVQFQGILVFIRLHSYGCSTILRASRTPCQPLCGPSSFRAATRGGYQ